MDEKEIIKWGLIALGAYLIYEYIQQQGGLTNVLAGSTTTGTAPGATVATTSNASAVASAQYLLTPAGITLSAAQQSLIQPGMTFQQVLTQVLTPAQYAQYEAYNPYASIAPPAGSTTTPPATAPPAMTPGTNCPAPQVLVNGVCSNNPAQAVLSMSQQVLNAAISAGEPNNLNWDQWCFYYSQISGNQCPDGGSIPPAVYAGAFPPGTTNADGSAPDRTTPMPISTWLAIIQNQAPSLGLSGFRGMGVFPSYRPSWLM